MKIRRTFTFVARGIVLLLLLSVYHFHLWAWGSDFSVAPMIMGEYLVLIGKPAKVNFKLRPINYGKQQPKTLTITLSVGGKICTTDGEKWERRVVQLPAPSAVGEDVDVPLSIDNAGYQQGDVLQLEVNAVNGQPNGATFTTTTKDFFVFTAPVPRKIVMEDYTGTWCPNCPKAMATMLALNRLHPEDFVGIAVHVRDAMSSSDFRARTSRSFISGYPFLHFNRSANGAMPALTGYSGRTTVVPFGCNADFLKARETPVEGQIRVAAGWDKERNTVKIASSTIFRALFPDRHYAVAYIVTGDGLKSGSLGQNNSPWNYQNYRGIVPEMDHFLNSGGTVYGLSFDDVALSGLGIDNGIDNSLPASLVLDHGYEHTAQISNPIRIAATGLVDKSKMYVCALLINTKTGEVVNADKCKITDGVPVMPKYAPLPAGETEKPVVPPTPKPEEPKPIEPEPAPKPEPTPEPEAPKEIKVAQIQLAPGSLNLKPEETAQLTATVLPKDATNSAVKWEIVSGENVIFLSDNGLITAKTVGEATVRAVAADGSGASAECKVKVNPRWVEQIQLTAPKQEIYIGDKFELKAQVLPNNATNAQLEWRSARPKVVRSLGNGLFVAQRVGRAVITAAAVDGSNVTAQLEVKVNPRLVESITLKTASDTVTVGDRFALQAEVLPHNATNRYVAWLTSDSNLAKNLGDGVFLAQKSGSVTISALANDGSKCQAVHEIVIVPPTSVANMARTSDPQVRIVGDEVIISPLQRGDWVRISNLQGRILHEAQSQGATLRITLREMLAILLLQVGGKSYKLLRPL